MRSVTTAAPPTPSLISVIAAVQNNTNAQTTSTWTNVANENSYSLQRARNAAFTQNSNITNGIAADTTTRVQTGLTRAVQYWYRVRATNSFGNSAWSNVVVVTTP